jgi:hypothetical protein
VTGAPDTGAALTLTAGAVPRGLQDEDASLAAAFPWMRAHRQAQLELSQRTRTSTDAHQCGHFRIASRKQAKAAV